VSSYLCNQISAIDSSLSHKLHVLPVPQNQELFSPDDTVERDPNMIVAVTRFTDQKRVDRLIKAMVLVVEHQPEAKLALYGDGPMKAEIESLIDKFGLKSSIGFGGVVSQTELRSIYSRAAIVVLNSIEEGFGLALTEGMLCGAAAIGSRSGGITDIIEHEKTGLLIDPDSIESLADAIIRLLANQSEREQFAIAGLSFARKNFTARPLAARYADLVHRAIDCHQR
jgi:glycosyltransferase involved in cell wall biosynthesis